MFHWRDRESASRIRQLAYNQSPQENPAAISERSVAATISIPCWSHTWIVTALHFNFSEKCRLSRSLCHQAGSALEMTELASGRCWPGRSSLPECHYGQRYSRIASTTPCTFKIAAFSCRPMYQQSHATGDKLGRSHHQSSTSHSSVQPCDRYPRLRDQIRDTAAGTGCSQLRQRQRRRPGRSLAAGQLLVRASLAGTLAPTHSWIGSRAMAQALVSSV